MDKLIILALIGALIGWMTNVIAIKLMFRPIEPIRIMWTKLKIQGLIPKRKTEIAKSIGDIINDELVSIEDIATKLIHDMDKKEVVTLIKDKVLTVANEKMPSMIPSMFKGMILQTVENMILENGEEMVQELGDQLSHKAINSINISEMVEMRINTYDFLKIEEMVLKIAKKELKHIELLGGVIGFVIGLLQGGIVLFLI